MTRQTKIVTCFQRRLRNRHVCQNLVVVVVVVVLLLLDEYIGLLYSFRCSILPENEEKLPVVYSQYRYPSHPPLHHQLTVHAERGACGSEQDEYRATTDANGGACTHNYYSRALYNYYSRALYNNYYYCSNRTMKGGDSQKGCMINRAAR